MLKEIFVQSAVKNFPVTIRNRIAVLKCIFANHNMIDKSSGQKKFSYHWSNLPTTPPQFGNVFPDNISGTNHNRGLFKIPDPLQLFLREILLSAQTYSDPSAAQGDALAAAQMEIMGEVIKYGVIVVSTLPVIIVYPFLQKYFVKGMMLGAVKG